MRTNLTGEKLRATGVATCLLMGGTAYAYWTAYGSGDGTAATAAGTVGLTVSQAALTAMYPGDAPQTISGTFANTNTGSVYVTSVTASIDSVDDGDADPLVGCTAADYTLTDAAMTVGAQVAVGDPVGAWTGATIQFNNTGVDQDVCQGATVNLTYSIA